MASRPSLAEVERLLASAAGELELPPTPPTLRPAVTERIRARRRALGGARPPFPGLAAWPRRRVLVLVAGALLLLAGAIGAARLVVVGAVEVRVLPTVPPPSGPPPSLGPSLELAEAQAMVPFPIAAPAALGPPDEVHVIGVPFARRVVLLSWRPGPGLPAIGGTPWGAMLMELPSRQGVLALKDVAGQTGFAHIRVDGHPGYWTEGAHDLVLLNGPDQVRLYVRGTVLLWDRGDVTFRLETALDRPDALRLAASLP